MAEDFVLSHEVWLKRTVFRHKAGVINCLEALLEERVILPDDSALIVIDKLKKSQEELNREFFRSGD